MSDRPAIPPPAPDTLPPEPWNQDDIPTEPGVEPNAYPNPPPLPVEPAAEPSPKTPSLQVDEAWEDAPLSDPPQETKP